MLIAVNLLVVVAVFVAVGDSTETLARSLRFIFAAADNIFQAQMLLLPIWAVLSSHRMIVRIIGLACGCALVGTAEMASLAINFSLDIRFAQLGEFVLWQIGPISFRVAIVVLALIVLWLNGLCLVRFAGHIAPRAAIRLQFSVLQLLVLIGAVATVLTLGNLVRASRTHSEIAIWLASNLMQSLASALLACAAVWSALSPARPALRVVLANLLAGLFGMLRAYFQRFSEDLGFVLGRGLGHLFEGVWLTGSLLVVRACGYRALWPHDWKWAAEFADQIESSSSA
jgi:hypothetical protein